MHILFSLSAPVEVYSVYQQQQSALHQVPSNLYRKMRLSELVGGWMQYWNPVGKEHNSIRHIKCNTGEGYEEDSSGQH